VAPKRYDYGYLVCYALSESKKTFNKKEDILGVEEGVVQLMGLLQNVRVIGGKKILGWQHYHFVRWKGYGETFEAI